MGEENPPAPADSLAVFSASGGIEIVAQVWDDGHFYSGMVYPPAFGSPQAVGRVAALRLLLHGAACALALLTALLCVLAWLRYQIGRAHV